MRDEFYGDRRDVWKWTVVLNEAAPNKQVIYVALYRPDEEPRSLDGVRADVMKFFSAERKELNAERRCSRITKLSSSIIPFLHEYNPKNSRKYFAPVKEALESRPEGGRYVVFFGP
jgi:hypothetical protein